MSCGGRSSGKWPDRRPGLGRDVGMAVGEENGRSAAREQEVRKKMKRSFARWLFAIFEDCVVP